MKIPRIDQPLLVLSLSLLLITSSADVRAQQTVTTQVKPSANQTTPLTLDEALKLAAQQASAYQQATVNEQIAAEDLKQARAAFLPRVSTPLSYIYTSPALALPPGTPRTPNFIANNAISEYEALVNVSGDIDIAGRLRATLEKNRALLAAAHAGTEVARRQLALTVIETYYGLALATAQRSAAEENLAAAAEFERVTSLLLTGGEVASVDLVRAQLQTIARRDELERARANEVLGAGALRVLVGYDFARAIATTDLALAVPALSEAQRFNVDTIAHMRLPSVKRMASGFVIQSAFDPLPRTDEWALLPDGTIAVVRYNDYHIDMWSPDGTKTSTPMAMRTRMRTRTSTRTTTADLAMGTATTIAM